MQASKERDVWISKALSWLLRHGAVKEGLNISPDGFIAVDELLNNKCFKSKCTVDDILRVVDSNDKQRFFLKSSGNGSLLIRANQGHSITTIDSVDLIPIKDPSTIKGDVIHGTYFRYWNLIKTQGLYRGKRNHIHFATGLPGSDSVISGARSNAQIFIYIDLPKALSSGLSFFLSANNVILSPGDEQGFVKPKYFLKVCKANDLTELFF